MTLRVRLKDDIMILNVYICIYTYIVSYMYMTYDNDKVYIYINIMSHSYTRISCKDEGRWSG